MPKEIKNITENVMDQIQEGKVKMKPKTYFILGSILTFLGLVSATIISIISVGLIKFSMRAHGPLAQMKLNYMIANFPWLILIIAVVGLIVGLWLIKKYEFSYKVKPWIIIAGFVLAIFVAGFVIDSIGFNEKLYRQKQINRIMEHPYAQKHFPRPSKEIMEKMKNQKPPRNPIEQRALELD
jgi:uncharacterized protein YacL